MIYMDSFYPAGGANQSTLPAGAPSANNQLAFRVGQTVMIVANAGGASYKAIIKTAPTAVNPNQVVIAYYEGAGQAMGNGVACDILYMVQNLTRYARYGWHFRV